MAAVDSYPSTPSLTNSEETISSGSDLLYLRPLPRPPRIVSAANYKQKNPERASPRFAVAPFPSLTSSNSSHSCSIGSHDHAYAFVHIWSQPRILQHIIHLLSWSDFRAVSRTCRKLLQIFHVPGIKDVTLLRFVPGYRSTSAENEDVRISLADLEALMLSQSLPLHRYPTHAVHVVTADGAISPSAQAFSDYLIRLAQAHSRFVLLLRGQALPWQITVGSDDLAFRPNPSLLGLRELTFPAPLSYFDPLKQKPLHPSPLESKKKRIKRQRQLQSTDPPPSARPGTLPKPVKSRLSIFGRSRERIPLPEPQSSPPSIKYYSSYGRARRVASTSATDDEIAFNHHTRFMADTLPLPRFPFAHSKLNTSNSSFGSFPRSLPSPLNHSLSLHDLSNALLRLRAPILRVFAPCSTLSESIATAEQQLYTSGLWPHLSVGDVVCNLGYVPEGSGIVNGWFVFTGEELYPFFPPEPAPVPDAKALPSPLYYSHLLPLFENLRIVLVLPRGVRITLSLALLSSSAPSPHSRAGFVRVKRYSWLGRLHVREENMEALGLGEGWVGEWILEAEGTKEGRQMLVGAIEENEQCAREREWLVVREKSCTGRVWLKMIPEQDVLDSLPVEP